MYLGCHLSASAGYAAMVETAVSIGADTFAFFTRNPRGSRARQEDPKDAARAAAMLTEGGFGALVGHGAYTMNLCTAEEDARAFAGQVLLDVSMNWDALRPNQRGGLGGFVGDAAFAEVEPIVAAISPVPGGVGQVTSAVLMRHTLEAAERSLHGR